MHDFDPTRRTAFKALALLGVGATGSTGVAAARASDSQTHGQSDDGIPNPSEFFVALLRPQPDVESNAHGAAIVQQRQDGLKFVLTVVNLENAMMSHIHEDEVLGPIAVWLYDFEERTQRLQAGTFTGILDVGTITDETIEEGSVEDAESETVEDLLETIRAGDAYVNVHTEDHPSGAIAGRIVPIDALTMMGRGGGY